MLKKRRHLIFIPVALILANYLMACTNEQLKRSTYYSIHEKQRRQCIEEERQDCSQYDFESYEEFQRKKRDQ